MKNAANPHFAVNNTVKYKIRRNDDVAITRSNHDRRIGAERSAVIRCGSEFFDAAFKFVEIVSGRIRIVQTDVIKNRVKIINGLLCVSNSLFSHC